MSGPRPQAYKPAADILNDAIESRDDCWLVRSGRLNRDGYGLLRIAGVWRGVHRAAYETWVGPIPAGLQIDHLCRVRRCINPEHLEAVTSAENTYRGNNPAAINARKTHCIRGHEFTPENTMPDWSGKGRHCRECRRASGRASEARRRAAAKAVQQVRP